MKILAIRLKNLASIEGTSEIDFTQEPLSSAGIFAITGPMGAGKSTLLDAVCLALYAKTPRYAEGRTSKVEIDDLNPGDPRGILRKGTGDGFAEVDFVGIDNKKYRSTWTVKRAHNKVDGAFQKDTLTIKDIDSNITIASLKSESSKEIERLVGLSFEQFTRSVLLAQGDFTAFLKADNNDKASLLERLTATSIYSKISQQVYNNHRSAQAAVDKLKSELSFVDILSDEQLESLKVKQVDITRNIESTQKQLDQLLSSIQWQQKKTELDQHKKSAQESVTIAIKRRTDSAERINTLSLVEEVQKIRPDYEQHAYLEQQEKEQDEQLQHAIASLKDLNASLEEMDSSIASAITILNDAIDQRKKALPNLEEARSIDIQLLNQEQTVASLEKEANESSLICQQKKEHYKNNKQILDNLNQEITDLASWKEKNLERQPIAENIIFIKSKLEDASRLMTAVTEEQQSLDTKKDEAKKGKEKIRQFEIDLASNTNSLEAIRHETNSLQDGMNKLPISKLENQRNESVLRLEKFRPAKSTWTILYEKSGILKDILQTLGQFREQLKNEQEQVGKIEIALPLALDKKNASEQRLQKARLEVSKDVESLRQQLVDGESCPICGSVDHPYTKHHPQAENILKLLEQEANDDHELWSTLLNKKQGLIESQHRLSIDIARCEKNQQQTAERVNELRKEWEAFHIYDTNEVDESQISSWLDDRIKEYQGQQLEAENQLKRYVNLEGKVKEKEKELAALEKQQLGLKNSIQLESGNLTMYEVRVGEIQYQLEHTNEQLNKIVFELKPYFRQETWFEKYKLAPTEFFQKILSFESEWKTKSTSLQQSERRFELLQAELNQLNLQLDAQQHIVDEKSIKFGLAKDLLNELTTDRNKLFQGAAVKQVEAELQEAIDAANLQLESAKKSRQHQFEAVATITAQVVQLQRSIENITNTKFELWNRVESWISQYNQVHGANLDAELLKELLAYSHDWIKKEKHSIDEINRSIIESEAHLKRMEREFSNHVQSNENCPELDILLPEKDRLEKEKAALSDQNAAIRFQLEGDALNRKKVGNILHKIQDAETIAGNWSKLNEMIGSADGKKFRQVAQEYTLDVLLSYANAHLDVLSKRYQLKRIESTLGLMVLDRDMGDEERTVVSLSGGESFLVSLALALGLASLSSTRMKVESLFIDEGFGSLDPATLNIAMDALERLHNQGRKVGVISHVQEMQERIMTQIKVTKQSTGKSIVTIVNGSN